MTEIEIEEAVVALLQTLSPEDCFRTPPRFFDPRMMWNTLCYAVEKLEAEKAARAAEREQHEAFRQEVSDAVEAALSVFNQLVLDDRGEAALRGARLVFARFIIAKADHIRSAALDIGVSWGPNDSDSFRAALAARGLKIVEDK